MLSSNAPRYAATLRHNATFRHYDDRYHITAKLVRDVRNLPALLAHLAGPLKDVTSALSASSRSSSPCSRSRSCWQYTVASPWTWDLL